MVVSSSRPATAQTQQLDAQVEGNQYASKTELLEWINGLLQLQLSKLEQFASGAVFCQLLDAYFKDAIPMHKVNYHASNEYEAVPNYKVLQQGFTALSLTREIHINKLARGSRTDLLELLQYLYKYLLKLKAQEGYNARERRALTVRGPTDAVPLPSFMSASQAAGRAAGNRSSGNWGMVIEPQQTLRGNGSFKRPGTASHAPGHGNTAGAGAASAGSSPDKADLAAAGPRRPCAPSRIPTASPNKDNSGTAATSPAASAPATAVAAAGKQTVQESAGEDETGVAVYQVLQKEEEMEELANARASMDDGPGCPTRIVIPDDVITSSMIRPLSPGGRSQLELCLGAAEEAIHVLNKSCHNMATITTTLPTCTDSYVYHGKIRSLLDASATATSHVTLLLTDVEAVCSRKTDGSASDLQASAQKLQQGLLEVKQKADEAAEQLQAAMSARDLSCQSQLNLQLTQLQKQLSSTAALDGCLRAVGTAYASLLSLSHREASAIAIHFLQNSSTAAQGGQAAPRVLKLGECAMKRLRNGDIYKGRYQGLRKNGEGTYCFMNGDVYEGEFKEDRMAGQGVYLFSPEGRYEGNWNGALYEGYGSETFAKGSTYHGQYAAGLRHGWGVCRFFNGDYYQGEWSKGVRDGCGMQQCTDDSNYCGQYVRGKRHGYGVYSFPNGDQYLGEYEADYPQGYGVYVFSSGQKYEGHWDKGKKHGWSIYTVETGQRWAGSWAEGKPQWVHPLPQTLVGAEGLDESQTSLPPEVVDNLSHASAACKNAQEASSLAASKLQAHWDAQGEVHQRLVAAVQGAAEQAAAAQAARRRAQLLAGRLDAAAVLIEEGSKGAHMKVVAH